MWFKDAARAAAQHADPMSAYSIVPRWLHVVPMAAAAAGAAAPASAQDMAATAQVVVVSATRHAMALVDAPAAMSVVPRETIEALGADNVLEALRGETGVTAFGRAIGGRRQLSLRGTESRHALTLVDGRRIGASDGVIGHSDFQLGWVAMEEIDRIEVLRGPLSALYGAEAMGGVLQIFTRAPAAAFEGSARAEASFADGGRGGSGHRAAARVSGPLGPGLRAAVTASDTRREAVARASDPRVSELEGRHRHDGSARLAWDLAPAHELSFDYRQGLEERFAHAVESAGQRRVYFTDTDVKRSHGALVWNADWSGASGGAGEWRSRVQAYGSRLAMYNQRTSGVAALRPNVLSDDVLEVQTSGSPAAGHLLTGGAEGRRERLGNEALPGARSEVDHRSVYLHDEWQATGALNLVAGLRYDEHERFGHEWSPRLYAVWRVAPAWVVKGGASSGFKPPTLKQVTPGYREDEGPFTYFSDPTLLPETNQSYEIGAAYDTREIGASAMLFKNRLKNLIVPLSIGVVNGRGQFVFANLASAELQGVETSLAWRPAAAWQVGLNFQYLDARDGAGQWLEKRPRTALGLTLAMTEGPWRAFARIDRVGEQQIANPVAGQSPNTLPAQRFVGASVARQVLPGVDLEAGVDNLEDISLAQLSPIFNWAVPPRTWRLALKARW
jgi:outer membrane receptor for ferrienterochelin and colicins